MTYPTQPPPSRPKTVSMSTYLLWVAAGASIIGAILSLTTVNATSEVYSRLYAGTALEGTEALAVGSTVFVVVLSILFAAGLCILAIFNNRGRNGARITTWILGGLMLCCGGFGLLGTAFQSQISGLETGGSQGGPTATELQEALDAALPSWFTPVDTVLTVISLLAVLGAVILLALPASNAFFRKPARGFDPSVPYPAYPGGQPPHPGGQPPYPAGQPPYPGGQPPYPTGQSPYPTYPAGGQPQYPAQPPAAPPSSAPPSSAPPSAPPSGPPAPPSSDPWSRPEGGEQKPPSDPTSQA